MSDGDAETVFWVRFRVGEFGCFGVFGLHGFQSWRFGGFRFFIRGFLLSCWVCVFFVVGLVLVRGRCGG